MNKIFKVIWSKSKQCYVVVSEMAKNTTGKKKIVVASILAGLAMSTMGTNVMAVSSIPFSDKPSSALGNGSVKPGTTNGVAIGNAAYSDSHQSIAIGFRSLASGTFLGGSIKPSVAVGAGAHAEGNNTVAIGTVAENRASYGVSLGNESKVTSGSDYGIAIGYQTQVSAVHSMAIGEKANASATLAIALGANAKATGAYSYTAGFNSESGGEAAIAVGKSASAGGESAVAVGNGTVATAGDAVAIGTSSQATGGDSIALGKSANASNGDSIAIGQDTVSNNINSVALGKTSKATGASATALGPQAKATGSTAVAIGLNSEANQSATVAVGYNSAASGENAAAYGNTAKAVGKNSLALGANTQATVEGGVALGAGSIANTVAGAGYNPNTGRTNTFTGLSGNALTSTWAAVSIGDGTNTRQLTGLAAGTNNTDAVNVAQLKSMNLAFTADGSTKGDVNLTNSALNVVGDSTYITTKGNNQTLTISGKKQNITVTNGTASASAGMADANNVAQAINQANADQTISYKANNGTANTVKVSDGLNFTNGTSTVATVGANGQVTYDLNSTTKQSITDSSTAVNRTIALGSDSGSTTAKKLSTSAIAFNIKGDTGANALITTTATGDNVSITPTAKLTAAVAAAENAANKNLSNISSSGETVIKNLAKGAAQDAVKVAGTGLATVSDNTVGGVKTYTVDVNTGNLVVAANGQVGAAGSNGVATTQNVATAINDAVTKAKASTTQALADAEHKFDGDTGTTSVRKHGEVLSIKGGVTNAADLATGNIGVVSDGAGTLNIRLAKVLSGLTSATFTTAGGNTTVINGDGVTITPSGTGASAISMTTDGINAGGKEVKGIADGTAADSAVSKGQMETAIANAQTAATSTEKVVAKTLSGDTNLATVTGQTGTAKGETYEVAVSENAVKNVAKAAAQDAVTVTGTGLATVSDNTTGGVKTYTVNVDEGKLVLDDTTGQIGANGSTQGTTAGKNGVATTQNVATAINDAITKSNANTAQALADAEHKFDGDTGTTSVRKHGEVLSIKGGVTTPADLATGNIGVISDGAGTLNIRLAKVLSGLTSATFTTAGGNTTVINGDGVTITPSGGASAISMTTDGINAGGKEVKGIADGTAADSAVSKGQMETAIANAQTAATSTEKVVAKTLSGDTNLATVTGQTGTAKGETYEVAVSENAVKNVAKAAAQDAVTVTGTGLATVSDNTTGGVKTYTVNVDEGKLVLDDTTGQIGANGSTQGTTAGKNGVATTQNVATAINDAVTKVNANNAQALADAKHNFAGDDATVISRKHGEQLNIKGGASTTATDLTSGNIAVVGDTTSGTLNIKMAKALTGLTSATFTDGSGNTQTVTGASSTITDGAGNTTAMTKGGVTTTDVAGNTTTTAPTGVTVTPAGAGATPISVTTSGISAGNKEIKNVANGTTDDAAVNKKQMDDALKGATDNTVSLGSESGTTTAKKLSTTGGIKFNIKGETGANALITTSATGDNVTIAPTAKLTAAVTAAEKSADKDLSNISSAGKTVIKDLAVTSAQDAVNVTGTGLATVSDNTTGGVKTYTVNVDEGKLVLDDTTGKIGANGSTQGTTAGKNGVATTQNVATAINDAITKSNANTAQALADAEHKFDGDTGTTSVRKHGEVLSIKGGVTTPADLTTGNIGVVSDGAGTLNIRLAKVLSGLTSATFKDASGNTTMVTGGSTTIADTSGNTQTLAPTKSEIKDNNGVSTVTTKDGVTAKDASGQTTSLTKGGVDATDGNGNTTSLTNTGVSATDGHGHTTGLTNGGLSTTDGTNTTTVAPTGITATDGTNTVKLNGSGIDAGNTEIKNVGKATTDDAAVNKKQMDDAITKATADATHEFGGDDATVVSRKHGEKLTIKGGATTTDADLTSGNIAVIGDATNGALNIKLAKALTGLTSATFKDASGNTTMVTGGSTTIADTSGNSQTLAPTKSEIKDNNGVSTVTTKDGVTAKDASGQTTSLTKGGVDATDGNGNTTSLTNTGVSATDGNGHTTGLTNGGLSTTDGTNTTTVAPTGMTTTDGTNTVKVEGSGIDAGGTQIKNVGKATTDDAAVNKKQMDDAITKATADATHEFAGDTGNNSVRKHGEVLSIKGGVANAADLTTGNIGVVSDGAGTLNIRLAKVLSGLTSATFKDASGNTTMVTGGSTTIADTSGNTQTLAPTKSEIKDNNGVSTVTTKDGVTAKDASGQTTSLTKGGVNATDGNGNTTSLTNTGVSATDGNGHTTGLTNGGLSTTDGTNTTTVAPTGITATDGTNTVKLNGSGIDAGNTEIKNVGKATTDDAAVNKKQMDDAITKATADATHEFAGDTGNNSVRKHGEVLSIKGGVANAADLTTGNIGVVSDGAGTLNIRLAKTLTGLTSATYTDTAGNTTTVTGGSTTIADTSGNTQTLAPTKSEIKDNNGVSTVTTKDGVTAKDASGQTTSLTKGGVNATDGNGNTTSLTNTGVSATDGNGHTTGLTNGGLSTTDGTNTTTVAPTGMTTTDGTNTVKVEGSGIDAGGTQIKNVGKATTDDAAVNKKQMDDAITKATADATHEFAGDTGNNSVRKHGEVLSIKGGVANAADLTTGNIGVVSDGAGTLNIRLAKALTGLTSATFTDTAGNTTTVTGASTTIADTSGNTQTLAPTKSEIKDNNGVSTVTTKDGVTAKDASGQTTSLTKGGVDATDGNGNTTSLTNTGVSATDGHGHTTGLTNGGLSTTDGTNTTTVAPTGMTATDGTNTVKVEGSGIDAGGTQIKNVGKATTDDAAVNKKQMDDAITKATADATHEFAGDTGSNSVRKHGEVLSIKGGVTDTNKLSDNNIGVISDGAGTLNVKLSKDLTGLTSATFKDGSGNTQTVTGASSTITDGTGNTTAMTKGGLSTTDGTNTTTVAPTGVTATDGTNIVKLNGSGIDAGNTQIKNVGKATTDDAAVNKKQMDEAVKAASDATKALGNNTITLGGDSVSTTTAKALNTTGGIQFNIKGQTGTDALITTSASGDDVTITPTDKLTNAVKAAEKSADKDLSNLSAAGNTHIQDLAKSAASWNVQTNGNGTTAVVGGDTVNFINGDNIAITNTGHAITIGTAKNVSFDKVTVGGMTLDKNGILSGITSIIGAGTGAPTMTFNSQNGNTPANVSINSNLDMGGHRITGVGPAEKPTDAVNKQQVDQALRGLAGLADNAARQYASKAGANAAALAALKPIQYDPLEPTQIMAGVGNYKSQTAVALGMAHYTNENTMFNIGVSLDSHDNMVNAGVTHKFGYSPEKKAIPDRYKGGPISSIYVMQDEMQALLAKDQEKDAVISKQASEIDTLRQQNEDMQRKIDMILAKLQ